jgi:hypothetical protein
VRSGAARRLSMYVLGFGPAFFGCAAVLADPAPAASPYVVDGVTLGSSFHRTRQYECSPSRQFAEYTWCRRSAHERTRQGSFSSRTSLLHSGGGVAYVSREIRPAFFGENDIAREIERLSEKYGAPAQKLQLPEREELSEALIVVWGSLSLEPLQENEVAALKGGGRSADTLIADHLGDIDRSLRLALPIYRLKGGPGYLWSATTDRNGRGHLRFLAIDEPALTGTKELIPSKGVQAAPRESAKAATALGAAREAPWPAGQDLRPFLAPQPTAMVSVEAAKLRPTAGKDTPQQSVIQKTRVDADRARLAEAERLADEEREKARVAWTRYQAESAAYQTQARLIWVVMASLLILGAIVTLLRIMVRDGNQVAPWTVRSMPVNLEALVNSSTQFARNLKKACLSLSAVGRLSFLRHQQ